MPPGDSSENAIRVQLSLMQGQDTEAAKQMAADLGQIAKMFDAFKAQNFVDAAEKMAKLHRQMVTDTQQMQQRQQDQAMQQRGGGRTVLGPSGEAILQTVSNADLASAGRDDSAARAEQQRKAQAERELKDYQEKERARLESLTPEHRELDARRQASGLPPIGQGPDDAWYNRVRDVSGSDRPGLLEIPRFGELNVQDYINLAHRNRLGHAMRAQAEGDTESANRYGKQAQRTQQLQDLAGGAFAAHNLFRRASNFAGSQGFDWHNMDAAGSALGYRRTEGAGGLGFINDALGALGVQSAFTAAGGEGFRQSMDITDLRMQSGINAQQASAIVQASASAGFSGDARRDVARNFMAPAVRQFGVDPNSLVPFTQVLRTGTAGVSDLSSALSDLGEVSRAARVDVNTMAQALNASGEAAQQAGGYYMSGVQFGRTFSASTGLTPNVGNQLLQNPTTQAYLAANTGLPTFAQGAASTTAKMEASRQAMTTFYTAYGGALGTRGQSTPIRSADGTVIGYDRGSNPAMAAVAQRFGVSSDEADKIIHGTDTASRVTAANQILDAYGRSADQAGRPGDFNAKRRELQNRGYRVTNNGVMRRASLGGRGGGPGQGPGMWIKDENATKELNAAGSHSAIDALSQDPLGGHITGRQDVIRAAHDAGIKGSALGDALDKNKTVKGQIDAVRKLVNEKAAADQAAYQIAFTGPAAKFFKALAKKTGLSDEYNDLPSNVAAASTRGPSPLSSASNTGLNYGP